MNILSRYKNPLKKILFLGYGKCDTKIIDTLINKKCNVDHTENQIDLVSEYDFAVSFGYRHIINKEFIKNCNFPIFNLHISYLPYNRGSHPNFWSFYDNTPSGVTIHIIDEGLDTGPIVFQKLVNFEVKDNTFYESYLTLKSEVENLFISNLELFFTNTWKSKKQNDFGTFHLMSDLPKNFSGWSSNINDEIKKLKTEGLRYD